jgi:hypothetical protein
MHYKRISVIRYHRRTTTPPTPPPPPCQEALVFLYTIKAEGRKRSLVSCFLLRFWLFLARHVSKKTPPKCFLTSASTKSP